MKVCIIVEGSYPYVSGGVSSWVQMLLERFDEIDFVIWSIATSREEMSELKYTLPSNVKEIKTIYLNDIKFKTVHSNIKLTSDEHNALKSLVMEKNHQDIQWKSILELIKNHKTQLIDILMSHDFFDIAVELYNSDFSRTIFNDFLWNLRSMFFPLLTTLVEDFPSADIYHSASTGYAGLLGSVASYINEKPFIITEHGIYTREREEEIIKSDWVIGDFKKNWINFFYRISAIAYQQAVKVISLFETNRDLQIEMGCPVDKTLIIPNGVDVALYSSHLTNTELIEERSKNKSISEKIRIGSIARIVPIKDIKTMILAFEAASQKVDNLELLILGPTEEDPIYYQEVLSLIDDFKLANVKILGRVDIKSYLPTFDMMLLTSISEGQPLAVLEGMAAGVPQICTNVGSCKELLYGMSGDSLGHCGIIVPVMNIEKIASAIEELANDELLRTHLGKIGYERARTTYQKKDFLDKYDTLYNSIMNSR
ncbi:MAG TPA: GT4 family glycosyltransferase PelF [Erysipelotrichaceae bacterium]|nr:GT4 family glycosyltransferase PelF [Erysipelotrichaceae bacterium]